MLASCLVVYNIWFLDLTSKLRDFKEKEQIKFQDSHAQSMIKWIQQNPEKIKEVAEVAAKKYENVTILWQHQIF